MRKTTAPALYFANVTACRKHTNIFPEKLPVNHKMFTFAALKRRGVRVVEGARLESVYTGNCIGGSNPPLSASFLSPALAGLFCYPALRSAAPEKAG